VDNAGLNVASKTILAGGGIVVRNGARPLVAVIQRSKDDRWVLPRGKLKPAERPIKGAEREVVEETGHRVRVREFLGAITYRARGRSKVVQFWRMQAQARPSYELMRDISAVEWLTLAAAVRKLSYPLEKLFLRTVGRRAIARRKPRAAKAKTMPGRKRRATRKAKKQSKRKKSKASARADRRNVLQRMLGKLGG